MPVELPPERSEEREPPPPNLIIWLILLAITMAAGAVLTLTTWRAGDPTNTVRFWIQLFARPFLVWAGLFGLRTLYWEQERARIDAENALLRDDRREGVRFASEPLAVLGYSYLTGAGTSKVSALLRKTTAAASSATKGGNQSGQYASLGLSGDDEDPTRYRACFKELISLIAQFVRKFPSDVPFSIRVHFPEGVDRSALLEVWKVTWSEAKLRAVATSLATSDRGVMELDDWLDVRGGPKLERCVLYVSVRLRESPSSPGAEAASAILLGWAPLVRRHGIRPVALLHRPVESVTRDIGPAMATALTWGQASLDTVQDVWLTGLSGEEKVAISKCVKPPANTAGKSASHETLRDITAVLGDIGQVSGWLAIALGIENALQTESAQLIACHEGTLRFSVVQPDQKKQIQMGAEA
jgi:hypothetical protein